MKKDPYAPYRSETGSPTHWRSLEHQAADPATMDAIDMEFPNGLASTTGFNRRDALKLSGASMALGFLNACDRIRRPEEGILPFVKMPEQVIPGVRLEYATALQRGEGAIGIVVESHEGRPTKIEGNPHHPSSLGSSDIWAQAEILRLYDPDRARAPMKSGAPSTWAEWDTAVKALVERFGAQQGKGLAILTEALIGPTFERLLAVMQTKLPEARHYRWDPLAPSRAMAGTELAFGPGARAHYDLEKTDIVFAVESDFLMSGPDHLRLARAWGASRAVKNRADVAQMKRLYVSEAAFSSTGANADHRLRLAAGQQIDALRGLAALLEPLGVSVGPEIGGLGNISLPPQAQPFLTALAKDLAAHKGRSLVLVGERQPPAVHALAHAINVALGALGQGLSLTTGAAEPLNALDGLKTSLMAGEVDTLFVIEANPLYTAPGGLEIATAFGKAKTVIHAGVSPDETGLKAHWHLPATHFLEAWGDAEGWDGTASIVQPLIHPLHGARAGTSLLAQVLDEAETNDKKLVEASWRGEGRALTDELAWRAALHDGVIPGKRSALEGTAPNAAAIAQALGATKGQVPSQTALELIALHGSALDGRLTNVSWIMEFPDSMTKLCWDNAVLMSPALAKALGIDSAVKKNNYVSDVVELTAGGRKITAPTFVLPGMAQFTLAINSGFGRRFGEVASGIGADVNPLLADGELLSGVALRKTGETVKLCSTQDHFSVPGNPFKELTFAESIGTAVGSKERWLSLDKRPVLRSVEKKDFQQHGHEALAQGDIPENLLEHGTPKNRPSKPIQPHNEVTYEGQQWGMTIDLSSCIGCNACAVACVAENNIPTVGREQVMLGREMHWIRVDRYFHGDVEAPAAVHQPVPCMHCENAPCEPVCPVSATTHDEEGLNSMAYNRCIGTRYCGNNCPYKVRRFNFLDFTHTGDVYVEPEWKKRMQTLKLQRNPDVTVRYRGTMEKCTYCTQRIEGAKMAAKREGHDRKALPDGAVTPACAQACPTQAITFGNINDPHSRVAQLKQSERNYEMLQELNVRPRTTYLARVRNENEELT